MKLDITPFTSVDALVQFREDYALVHGPKTREKVKRESEMDLSYAAEKAVADFIKATHEQAEAKRAWPEGRQI